MVELPIAERVNLVAAVVASAISRFENPTSKLAACGPPQHPFFSIGDRQRIPMRGRPDYAEAMEPECPHGVGLDRMPHWGGQLCEGIRNVLADLEFYFV